MSNPQLEAVIAQVNQALSGLEGKSLPELRQTWESLFAGVSVDADCQPLSAGGVDAEWVRAPGVSQTRTILYLHGGGYVLGSVNSHRELLAYLSKAADARVLGLNYRLGPEHPFPAALDDALAAYRWLLEQGTAAADLAIAGDSAGGGLSVATLVALRDCKQPLPAAAALRSPWVDLSCSGATMETRAHLDPIVHKQMTALMGSLYLSGADPTNPLASPIHASLTGLPPLLVQVGGRETLWDDSMRLVANARRDGVDVTLETEEDMIHVWQIFPSRLLEARQAIERIGVFVKRHLR